MSTKKLSTLSFRAYRGISHILILFLLITITACEDDDDNCQGIDCLPPATQTGAGTFGCLVNGEPFVDNSGSFNCFYQFVDGEYYFSIRGRVDNFYPRSIKLGTFKLALIEQQAYELVEETDGNAFGSVIFNNLENGNLNTDITDSNYNGLFTVNKFDFEENIISGTFSFTVRDEVTNKIVNITNGRFDSHFTQ